MVIELTDRQAVCSISKLFKKENISMVKLLNLFLFDVEAVFARIKMLDTINR
jgi:hypothetical protein